MSRAQERSGIDDATRIRLLETDADQTDANLTEIRREMREGFRRCEEDSDGLRKVLTGLLIAVVTTSITIVATVLITAGGLS